VAGQDSDRSRIAYTSRCRFCIASDVCVCRCVGQMGRAIETRQKENMRHLYLTACVNLLLCFVVTVQNKIFCTYFH